MFYENEFELFRKTLEKCALNVAVVSSKDTFFDLFRGSDHPDYGRLTSGDYSLENLLGGINARTVYKFKDAFSLCYIAFLLGQGTGREMAVIGPFLQGSMTEKDILEICEQNGFEPKYQRRILELIAILPVLSADNPLYVLLESFCERMWDGAYETVEVVKELGSENTPFMGINGSEIADTFLDMKNMERRYALENEIIDAVVHGSDNRVYRIFASFNEMIFENRASDPVRNTKNYCIIMNTLFRKAAEQGGVHPVHLNKISSGFAIRIEQFTTVKQGTELMSEMITDYCRLVRKHSSGTYSPLVKAAISAIDADPSSELSLNSLAKQLNVSKVYLSTIFKKETGKTLTEYTTQRRISYAKHLLRSTSLQIQTVALHCGMVDIHYFSKLFKQKTGKTPSEFRAEARKKS